MCCSPSRGRETSRSVARPVVWPICERSGYRFGPSHHEASMAVQSGSTMSAHVDDRSVSHDGIADPVFLHAIRNSLLATVREMAVAVTRTAYSALIAGTSGSVGDTDAAVLTAGGQLIATDEGSIIHMASLPTGMSYVLAEFPMET